ncbi:VTT domain-containing protein [Hoeflea sp. YIM 152468]|uniref:TVP38/TMEM64 family protein n=1 Tax=Hoeflea sp. YIM 152468 TaxID=3031759 RepID=UPI0023DC9E6B|nr:VTT domain-containing protein [Hoeflea sp. YIM 152468]MDF1607830.1 VTT domain-containing protein [Hoeflea sp. YIM 152468]
MKPLIKVMLFLGTAFALTFILGRLFGLLTVENVRHWLELAGRVDPLWLAGTVVLLLFLDLFVAVPTLTITILGGFFLGFPAGAITAFAGMSLAAFSGYGISRIWGDRAVSFLVRNKDDRLDMARTFRRNGPAMIVLSRAAPIVPEVTACMAGATNMPFAQYIGYFSLSTLPYVTIASYAGSISSPQSPQPAIYAALALYAVLWIGWYLFRRNARKVTEN